MMVVNLFPDAPITPAEWSLFRTREKTHTDLARKPFCNELTCVDAFMDTRDSCDVCGAQIDYGEVRFVAIEITGQRDNLWCLSCKTCGEMDHHRVGKSLVYRLNPRAKVRRITLARIGLAA